MQIKPTPVNVPVPVISDDIDCVHWWQLESPHGTTSIGVCKYCGEVKEFSNRVDLVLKEGYRVSETDGYGMGDG